MSFSVADEIANTTTKEKVKLLITNYNDSLETPYLTSLPKEGRAMLGLLVDDYIVYKKNYAKNIAFGADAPNLSK